VAVNGDGDRPRRDGERRQEGSRWHWWAILALAAAALALGAAGFSRYYALQGEARSGWHILYVTLQLFTLESGPVPGPVPWELNAARFLAPIVPAWAVVRTLLLLFGARLRLLRVRRLRDHTVVCGLGRKGRELVRDFHALGERVVVLERDGGCENLALCRSLGVPAILGNAADLRSLQAAAAERARHLIAVTGDDGTNVAIAVLAYRLAREKREPREGPVNAWVQVVDLRLATLLERHRMLTEAADRFAARVFNPYESSARLALRDHPLDREWLGPRDPRSVRLIVVGFGQMGECLTLQAARQGAYANGRPIRITVVDRDAERKEHLFRERYPDFGRIGALDFIAGEAADPALLAEIQRLATLPGELTTLAICFDDDSRSLSCALDILPRLREARIPLLVRMSDAVGLATLLECEGEQCGWAAAVHPFGMVDGVCNRDTLLHERLDTLARALHETYVGHRLAQGAAPDKPSLRPWDRLDEAYRESNRQAADQIAVKLRALRCTTAPAGSRGAPVDRFADEEVEILARMEHARWCAERLLAGWTAGQASLEKRTTPHIVGWDDLDEPTREIDRELVREIPRVVRRVGDQVYRQE